MAYLGGQSMTENIVAKLRDMHALAADSCDPQFSAALLEAADEIERLKLELSLSLELAPLWGTKQ